nr:LacI family DNA-binding transcriptional regulator [Agromyces archimandritae]
MRDAIDTLGFVRDANASSLAAGGSRSIGLVVINLGNSMFVDVARGAQTAAHTAGLNLLLAGSEDSFAVQGANVDSFNEARVQGLLLAPLQDSSSQTRRMTQRGRPVVIVNYDASSDPVCCVVVDNEQVGYLAAKHLLDSGCERIAFLGGEDEKFQPVRLRRRGVRRAMAEAGRPVAFEEIAVDELTDAAGARAADAVAARSPGMRPDGVVAVTDTVAVGFIERALDLGIDVPGQIAVMGCDRNTSAPDCRVPLSSVAMQGYEMGTAAMRLLLDEIAHTPNHVHQRVVLAPSLVVRASTAGFRGGAADSHGTASEDDSSEVVNAG